MSEEEYWESDPDWEDEDFGDVYLADEQEDIDIITMPKFKVDVDNVIEQYAKALNKCKTMSEAKNTLLNLYVYAQTVGTIEYETRELQNRAKSLEVLAQALNLR
ncbi:hypothetical protein [Heyndrickxia oleronia]|jgi:hypothetical protein|uniref:hypothetical protein n=1 Tax=Heyndrickxia oleronia TaxID=38875 RepID=UPI00242B51DA|nr:hypothetical protein [Heyndrickxia oleronia]MCI1763654.1 hypothetical protein [Heyndrickxia oleronia]